MGFFFFGWWGWQPYAFHHVMRSLFVTLRLAATARQLEFITDLDQTIDLVRVYCFFCSTPSPPSTCSPCARRSDGRAICGRC